MGECASIMQPVRIRSAQSVFHLNRSFFRPEKNEGVSRNPRLKNCCWVQISIRRVLMSAAETQKGQNLGCQSDGLGSFGLAMVTFVAASQSWG